VRELACTGTCGFAIQKRIAGRAISAALAGVLLNRRRTQVLRGFRSKAGKQFSAMLVLDEQHEVRFEFANGGGSSGERRPAAARPRRSRAATKPARAPRAREQAPISAELTCPRCSSGTLIAGSRGWGCSRWRAGCGFVVWFETAGRRLSAAQLRDLVIRGKTRKGRFVSDRGVEIDGRLVLDASADGGSARLEPS
jgi:DNA topoisomerase-3